MSEIVRYWTTCEDGIHGMDPAPPGKGNWVKYTDHVAAIAKLEALLPSHQHYFVCPDPGDQGDGCLHGLETRLTHKCSCGLSAGDVRR